MSGKDDYPEHLNPFRERRGSLIRSSFRGLFNTLRRKKHDKTSSKLGSPPTIRKHSNSQEHTYTYRKTVPAIRTQPYPSPVPLPRYRASEVLPKPGDGINYNPFDEEDEKDKEKSAPLVLESPPTPLPVPETSQEKEIGKPVDNENIKPGVPVRRSHRRKKRRAPLPPGYRHGDSNLLNVPSSQSNSQWSLTSEYSEYSSYASEYGDDVDPNSIPLEASEDLLNITREISKLNDDSNNNIILNDGDMDTKESTTKDTSEEDAKSCDKEIQFIVKDKIDIEENTVNEKKKENNKLVNCNESLDNVEATKVEAIEEKSVIVNEDINKKDNINNERINTSDVDATKVENIYLNKEKINKNVTNAPKIENDQFEKEEMSPIHDSAKAEDTCKTEDNVLSNEVLTNEKEKVKLPKVSSIDELDEFDKDLADEEIGNFKESLESITKSLDKDLDIETEKEVNEEKEVLSNNSSTKSNLVDEMNNINKEVTDNKFMYIENITNEAVEIREKEKRQSEENRMSIKDRIEYFESPIEEKSIDETPVPKTRAKKLNKAALLGS